MPKIGLFSVSCCEPPNRSRVKVEVDSGSPVYEVEKPWYDPTILIYQEPSYLQESTSHDYYMNGGSTYLCFPFIPKYKEVSMVLTIGFQTGTTNNSIKNKNFHH